VLACQETALKIPLPLRNKVFRPTSLPCAHLLYTLRCRPTSRRLCGALYHRVGHQLREFARGRGGRLMYLRETLRTCLTGQQDGPIPAQSTTRASKLCGEARASAVWIQQRMNRTNTFSPASLAPCCSFVLASAASFASTSLRRRRSAAAPASAAVAFRSASSRAPRSCTQCGPCAQDLNCIRHGCEV
jgi:hypothetical protein